MQRGEYAAAIDIGDWANPQGDIRGGHVIKTASIQAIFVALVCLGVARPALAQSANATFEVPLISPSTEPKRLDDPNNATRRQPQPGELTYQGDTSETGNGRTLHYRLDTTPDTQSHESPSVGNGTAAHAIDDGAMDPYTLSARINKGQSWVRALGGYDTAANSVRARSAAETAVTSWFAIRVDYDHGQGPGLDDRVGLGGRFQILDQSRHGIDLGFGAFYQPRDFRSEGNIVGGLMLGRRFGRLGLFASALVGSDPEGDDQDTEGRLSTLYRATDAFSVGLDNRFRYVLSTDQKRYGTIMTDWELQLEPTVIVNWGPLALMSEAGLSALQNTGPIGMPENRRVVHTGVIAMAGAGAVF